MINSPEFNILLLQKKPIDIEVNIPVKNTAGIFILEDLLFLMKLVLILLYLLIKNIGMVLLH